MRGADRNRQPNQREANKTQQNRRRRVREKEQQNERRTDRSSRISQREADRNGKINNRRTDRNGAGPNNNLSFSDSQRQGDEIRSHGSMQPAQPSKNYTSDYYGPQVAPSCPYYKIKQKGTVNNYFMAPQNGSYGHNGPVYTAPGQIQAHIAPQIPGLLQFGPYAPQNAPPYVSPPYDQYNQVAPQTNPQNGPHNNAFHAAPRQNNQFRPQSGHIAPPTSNQQPPTSPRQRNASQVEDDDDFIVELESL